MLPQFQLVEKLPVVSNHRCSVVQTAENCGVSAVAVHDDRRYPCRGAEAVSYGLAVQQTIEILVLNLNTVIDVPVAQVVQVPSYSAVTCSVFAFRVQDSGLFWVMTSGNVPVFSASLRRLGFLGAALVSTTAVGFAGVDALRAMFPSLFSGPDVLHRGRYGPEGPFCGSAVAVCQGHCLPCRYAEAVSRGPASLADHRGFAVAVRAGWSMSGMQSCRFLRSCSSSTWSSSPLSLRRVYPMVQTVVKPGNPQLLYKVVYFPVSWSCRFTSRRGAEDRSSDHRDFAVAVRVGWLMSLLCGVTVLVELPQLRSSFCVDTVVHILAIVQRQMPGGSDVTVAVTSRG